MRTPEQIKEAIKRHKRLQREWAVEADEAKSAGRPMLADGCLQAVDNHKRSVIVCESELRSAQ